MHTYRTWRAELEKALPPKGLFHGNVDPPLAFDENGVYYLFYNDLQMGDMSVFRFLGDKPLDAALSFVDGLVGPYLWNTDNIEDGPPDSKFEPYGPKNESRVFMWDGDSHFALLSIEDAHEWAKPGPADKYPDGSYAVCPLRFVDITS